MDDELEPLETMKLALQRDFDPEDAVSDTLMYIDWSSAKPEIAGGIILQFYPSCNIGMITYLVVNSIARGKGISRLLVEKGIAKLNSLAKRYSGSVGCNLVLLETNLVNKLTKEQDVMDPSLRHLIYRKMGFRKLDFRYVMPPLSPELEKVDCLLLLAKLTPFIPYEDGFPFVPSFLMKRAITAQWDVCHRLGNVGPPAEDPDFVLMMHSFEVADKVWLLDMPWTETEWILMEVTEKDEEMELLHDYHARLVHSFPGDAAAWPLRRLSLVFDNQETPTQTQMQVLLVMVHPDDSSVVDVDDLKLECVGGICAEYYPSCNLGMISFDVVDVEGLRADELVVVKELIEESQFWLDKTAESCGRSACGPVFMDMEEDPASRGAIWSSGFLQSEASYARITGASMPAPYHSHVLFVDATLVPVEDDGKQYISHDLLSSLFDCIRTDEDQWRKSSPRAAPEAQEEPHHEEYHLLERVTNN